VTLTARDELAGLLEPKNWEMFTQLKEKLYQVDRETKDIVLISLNT